MRKNIICYLIFLVAVIMTLVTTNNYKLNALANSNTDKQFITCDKNGNNEGNTFSKATIQINNVDNSGNYLYYGVDIAIKEKTDSGEWTTLLTKRVPTNSLSIEISDFGDMSKYKNGKVYSLSYRVLYQLIDQSKQEVSVIETEWKNVKGAYFKLNENNNAQTFSDLSPNHWAYQEIISMKNKGIVSGYGDGTFKPKAKVTREQLSKLMVLCLDLPVNTPQTPTFSDTSKDRWSYKYVESTKQYFDTYSNENKQYFRGDEVVTREDIVSALVKAKGYDEIEVDTGRLKKLFKDHDQISKDKAKHILVGYDKGILEGYNDGTFRPQKGLSRAEAVVLLDRIMNM